MIGKEKLRKTLFDYVKADLDQRDKLGFSIHGKDLFHTNKNDFIKEAYEEALDLAIYLRGVLQRQRDSRMACMNRYRKTPKAKITSHRYNTSDKGKAAVKRYTNTPKGQVSKKRYWRSPKRVERAKWQMKSYRTRNMIKALL
jgi:hypothetical protein